MKGGKNRLLHQTFMGSPEGKYFDKALYSAFRMSQMYCEL